MSKKRSTEEIRSHKDKSLQKLSTYLNKLIEGDKDSGKASKLCYWINDWITFLDFEPNFSPLSLRRYKRGEVIKVHLGFNVGSEEGGLHYAVVLDKKNVKSSPVVTIIPLTSVKQHTDISKLKSGSIFLGNELFTNLNAKISSTHKHLEDEINLLSEILQKTTEWSTLIGYEELTRKVKNAQAELDLLKRMRSEVLNMKKGSIALVNQITTVSKIRIYDPKTDHDILSNVKLSNEKLDMIDEALIKKFTNL